MDTERMKQDLGGGIFEGEPNTHLRSILSDRVI